MPPTVLNHYFGSRNEQKIVQSLIPSFHAYVSKHKPALNTNFFKVNIAYPMHTQFRTHKVCAKKANVDSDIPGS